MWWRCCEEKKREGKTDGQGGLIRGFQTKIEKETDGIGRHKLGELLLKAFRQFKKGCKEEIAESTRSRTVFAETDEPVDELGEECFLLLCVCVDCDDRLIGGIDLRGIGGEHLDDLLAELSPASSNLFDLCDRLADRVFLRSTEEDQSDCTEI